MSDSATKTELPPFEKAIFDALRFEAHQVRKVDLSIGPRSQSVTLKFALTPEQVQQLDEMVNPPAILDDQGHHLDSYHHHQLDRLNDDGNTVGLN
jgi:hypothetical protein